VISIFSLDFILKIESELKRPNRDKADRLNLISNYNKKYKDINNIIEILPNQYIKPLLNGLESQIRFEIVKEKARLKIELRKRNNKSLEVYENDLERS
jgi:hypothetical protein